MTGWDGKGVCERASRLSSLSPREEFPPRHPACICGETYGRDQRPEGGGRAKLALIGCGHWGPNHMRTFNRLPGSAMERVVDLDPGAWRRCAAHPGFAASRTRRGAGGPGDRAWWWPPRATHYRLVRDALLAGKHVLCEKPSARRPRRRKSWSSWPPTTTASHVARVPFNRRSRSSRSWSTRRAGGPVLPVGVPHQSGPDPQRRERRLRPGRPRHLDLQLAARRRTEQVLASGASFLQPDVEDVVSSRSLPERVLAVSGELAGPKKVRQITVVGSSACDLGRLQLTSPIAIFDKAPWRNPSPATSASSSACPCGMGHPPAQGPLDERSSARRRASSRHRDGTVQRSDGAFAVGVVRALEAIAAPSRPAAPSWGPVSPGVPFVDMRAEHRSIAARSTPRVAVLADCASSRPPGGGARATVRRFIGVAHGSG